MTSSIEPRTSSGTGARPSAGPPRTTTAATARSGRLTISSRRSTTSRPRWNGSWPCRPRTASRTRSAVAEPVRLIKRYANRKLYDTGSGELTSLSRIEELVREGLDIRVVDHDTGEDMTSEVLVGILGNAMGAGTIEG